MRPAWHGNSQTGYLLFVALYLVLIRLFAKSGNLRLCDSSCSVRHIQQLKLIAGGSVKEEARLFCRPPLLYLPEIENAKQLTFIISPYRNHSAIYRYLLLTENINVVCINAIRFVYPNEVTAFKDIHYFSKCISDKKCLAACSIQPDVIVLRSKVKDIVYKQFYKPVAIFHVNMVLP
jgi:hypothetical protein